MKNCNFAKGLPLNEATTTKQTTMKSKSTFIVAALFAVLFLASCGAGRKASCDAYGSVQQTEQNADLATR